MDALEKVTCIGHWRGMKNPIQEHSDLVRIIGIKVDVERDATVGSV